MAIAPKLPLFCPVAFNVRGGSSPETKALNPDPAFHRKRLLFQVLVPFLAQQTSEGWVENAPAPTIWCLWLSPEGQEMEAWSQGADTKLSFPVGNLFSKGQSSRNNQWLVTVYLHLFAAQLGCAITTLFFKLNLNNQNPVGDFFRFMAPSEWSRALVPMLWTKA